MQIRADYSFKKTFLVTGIFATQLALPFWALDDHNIYILKNLELFWKM